MKRDSASAQLVQASAYTVNMVVHEILAVLCPVTLKCARINDAKDNGVLALKLSSLRFEHVQDPSTP